MAMRPLICLKPFKWLAILSLAVLCNACDFHLRGNMELPEAMNKIYFENASSNLTTQIKQLLRFSNAKITSGPANANIIVRVLDEQYRKTSLSLTSIGKSNEYGLYLTIDFEILDAAGKVLLPKKSLMINRSLFVDQTLALAKGNEEILIRQDMYNYAAREMVEQGRYALISAQP